MKSYIGPSSCHLTSTSQPAHQTGFIGALQLGPQNDNVRIKNFFFPWFCLSKLSKIRFFPETYNASPFRAWIYGKAWKIHKHQKLDCFFRSPHTKWGTLFGTQPNLLRLRRSSQKRHEDEMKASRKFGDLLP